MASDVAVKWENPLAGEEFPVIVENGEPRAVVLDIRVFRRVQALLDNLVSADEPEDAVLAKSPHLRAIAEEALASGSSRATPDWRRLLHGSED